MGQNEAKPLRERRIFLDQIQCTNQNRVITGIMAKAHKQLSNERDETAAAAALGKENNQQNSSKITQIVGTSTALNKVGTQRMALKTRGIGTPSAFSDKPQKILILKNSPKYSAELLQAKRDSCHNINNCGVVDSSNMEDSQIIRFHRRVSESVKKDSHLNQSMRESCRGGGGPSERFSTSSQQYRMSSRQSCKAQSQSDLEQIVAIQKEKRRILGLNKSQGKSTSSMNVNCSFQEKFMALSDSVQQRIIAFLFDQQHRLRSVNSIFYYSISNILELKLVELDNSFIKNTMRFLSFRESYNTVQPMTFRGVKGVKLDRHIVATILPSIKGQSVKLSFTYKNASASHQKRNQRYKVEYQFDANDDKKVVWAFKEDCRHNYDDEDVTFVQPISASRVGDNIKLTISFFNLNGLMDLNSILWGKPEISIMPRIPVMIDPSEIEEYDANRICEIEQLYTTWCLYDYFYHDQKCQLNFFEPILRLKETRCAGVDLITSKLIFVAASPGIVNNSWQNFGVHIKVVDKHEEAVSAVKKLGIFSDSEPATIHLRVGDTFVFYIAKGD